MGWLEKSHPFNVGNASSNLQISPFPIVMLLLLGVLCYFCWRGFLSFYSRGHEILSTQTVHLFLSGNPSKLPATFEQRSKPLWHSIALVVQRGSLQWLVIIPTYLGSFSSPIYPKQPGVSILSNSHCSIPKSWEFWWRPHSDTPSEGVQPLSIEGVPEKDPEKSDWLHPRSLTNSSPLKNDA